MEQTLEERIKDLEKQVQVFIENAKYYDHKNSAKAEELRKVLRDVFEIMADKLVESGR